MNRFGRLLRTWRNTRGRTQLQLAEDAGISTRHLSFIENGRAQPSREMVALLLEALDVPTRDRNDWLAAAGFAPACLRHYVGGAAHRGAPSCRSRNRTSSPQRRMDGIRCRPRVRHDE